MKRVLDLSLAWGLLTLFAPLMLLIALGIKLTSAGPVVFRQRRVGKDGRLLTCYKFRSMTLGAAPELHREHVSRLIQDNLSAAPTRAESLKMRNDPRVTRFGRLLRRTSLDELPQLFNVLKGEMSLVGPRPAIAYEVELYEDWHRRRLAALPGITGYWQVAGRNQVSFDDMVRLDLYYIDQASLWLDLRILARTPLVMVTGRGGG